MSINAVLMHRPCSADTVRRPQHCVVSCFPEMLLSSPLVRTRSFHARSALHCPNLSLTLCVFPQVTAPAQYWRRGILSTDPRENPEFHNFNIAIIAYCDGAARLGRRGAVTFDNSTLVFDGLSNLQQVLQGNVLYCSQPYCTVPYHTVLHHLSPRVPTCSHLSPPCPILLSRSHALICRHGPAAGDGRGHVSPGGG